VFLLWNLIYAPWFGTPAKAVSSFLGSSSRGEDGSPSFKAPCPPTTWACISSLNPLEVFFIGVP